MSKAVAFAVRLYGQARLRKILSDKRFRKELDKAVKDHISLYMQYLKAYPDKGPWNRVPEKGWGRYYVRLEGGRYKRKTDGGITELSESGRMQKNWKRRKIRLAKYEIINAAANDRGRFYARYIYHPDDRVWWAKDHGWKDYLHIWDEVVRRHDVKKEIADRVLSD